MYIYLYSIKFIRFMLHNAKYFCKMQNIFAKCKIFLQNAKYFFAIFIRLYYCYMLYNNVYNNLAYLLYFYILNIIYIILILYINRKHL